MNTQLAYSAVIILLLLLILCVGPSGSVVRRRAEGMQAAAVGFCASQADMVRMQARHIVDRISGRARFHPAETDSSVGNVNPLSAALTGEGAFGTGRESYIVRGVDDPREVVLDAEYVPQVTYDDYSGSGNTYGLDPGYKYGPFHDLDPDFNSSRARYGACKPGVCGERRINPAIQSYDSTSLGTRNDDVYDGERCAAPAGVYPCARGTPRTAVRIMYKDIMGLDYADKVAATKDDCELLSDKGYVYREPCGNP